MTISKPNLTQYSLKFSAIDHHKFKLLGASDTNFPFLYNLCDAAITWAWNNKEELLPVANPSSGSFKSYYICDSSSLLMKLKDHLNCTDTRAVYTALMYYLKHRDKMATINAIPVTDEKRATL